MFLTPEQFIDTVQNGKRYFVDTFVNDEALKKTFHSYINAQTEFAKTASKTMFDVATACTKTFTFNK